MGIFDIFKKKKKNEFKEMSAIEQAIQKLNEENKKRECFFMYQRFKPLEVIDFDIDYALENEKNIIIQSSK